MLYCIFAYHLVDVRVRGVYSLLQLPLFLCILPPLHLLGERTACTQDCPVPKEDKGSECEQRRQPRRQRTSALDPKLGVHRRREEREDGSTASSGQLGGGGGKHAHYIPQEGLGGESRGGKEAVTAFGQFPVEKRRVVRTYESARYVKQLR